MSFKLPRHGEVFFSASPIDLRSIESGRKDCAVILTSGGLRAALKMVVLKLPGAPPGQQTSPPS